MRWQPDFWHHRPIKTSHADTRPRHAATHRINTLRPGVSPGVEFEVRNFQIYGGLRRAHTEVRNTLPTALTIKTERTLLTFEEQKKNNPYDVDYSDLYRCLSAQVVPSPTAKARMANQKEAFNSCNTQSANQKEAPSTAPATSGGLQNEAKL